MSNVRNAHDVQMFTSSYPREQMVG